MTSMFVVLNFKDQISSGLAGFYAVKDFQVSTAFNVQGKELLYQQVRW